MTDFNDMMGGICNAASAPGLGGLSIGVDPGVDFIGAAGGLINSTGPVGRDARANFVGHPSPK